MLQRGINGLWRRAAPGAGTRALSVPHRLALAYLLLPVAVWLLGWFKWWIGWPLAALLGACLAAPLAGSWRRRPRRETWALLLLALGWVMLTAAGGIFDRGNYDWRGHRLTLLDLGRHPWPPFLADDLQAYLGPAEPTAAPLLRYYLGWYLVPGLAARLWGTGALQWAVPLWTWLGVALLLLLATQGLRGRRVWLAAAVLIFFSGLDVLRVTGSADRSCLDIGIDRVGLPGLALGCFHIEWWPPYIRLKYLSHMAALMLAPQHFLPAGLGILSLWRLQRSPRFLAMSGVWWAAVAFWSPFVAVGLLPFAALLLRANGLRPFLRWPNLVLAGPLAGLAFLYLTAGALDFPRGGLWTLYPWARLAREIPWFYLIEFLLIALLLAAARPAVRRDAFFLTSVAVLLLAPWYLYAGWNFSQRASQPALMLLGCHCAVAVAGRGRTRRRAGASGRRWALAGLAGVLGIGALTGAVEVARSTRDDRPFRYALATNTNWELPERIRRENFAFELPPLLAAWLRPPRAAPRRQAGARLVRGVFDVYWDGTQLIYAQTPCRWDSARDRLWVRAVPRDGNAAPEDRDVTLGLRRIGEACGLLYRPPPFPLAALRLRQQGQSNWEAYVRLDERAVVCVAHLDARALQVGYQAVGACPRTAGPRFRAWQPLTHPLAAARAYRAAAQVAQNRRPVARAAFDVYLRGRALTMIKTPCAPTDTDARFFLHAFPRAADQLPRRRRGAGFANLDFAFAERGARFSATCAAVVRLPAYALSRLRVGQFQSDGVLWTAEIHLAAPVSEAVQAPQAVYQALTATAPAARSVFDVYLTEQRAVAFVKDACRPTDADAKFMLHVFPAVRWRLSPRRWVFGFDNRSVSFATHGVRLGATCLIRAPLPAYAIDRLRVGQFNARAQRIVWQTEIPLREARGATAPREPWPP